MTSAKKSRQLIQDIPHDVYYVNPVPAPENGVFLAINRAGIVKRTPEDFCIKRDNSYRFCVVHCVLSGRGVVETGGRERALEKGCVFLLGPGQPHMYKSDPAEPMGLCWAEFSGPPAPELMRLAASGGSVLRGGVFSRAMALISELIMRADSGDAEAISLALYKLLTELCAGRPRPSGASDALRPVLDYIDKNLGQPLTLGELAAQFGYNPSYFSRRFASGMGMTPPEYIRGRRLSRACMLLAATDKTLDQIALELGFYDASHFIARFKLAEGMTPAAYRRQNSGFVGKAR